MIEPAISIIIPVYNREKLILEALESLKLQSFENWECIIVDDYSTDGTIKEIEKFIKIDTRFKLIQKKTEKTGAPSSRNIGYIRAVSNYIVFLDSDDLLAPWALENRVAFMNENQTLDFALFNNIEFLGGYNSVLNMRVKYKVTKPLLSFLSFDPTWQTSSPTWKKTFLDKINGWDEDALSWQDPEIHIRSLLQKPSFLWYNNYMPDCFIRLEGNDKVSSSGNIVKLKNNFETFKKILQMLPVSEAKHFKRNVKTMIYNRVEQLDMESALELINSSDIECFDIQKLKINFYIKLFQKTKFIKGLRKFVFLIREKTKIYTKRKIFFQKETLDKKTIQVLKKNLTPYDLYNRNFQL